MGKLLVKIGKKIIEINNFLKRKWKYKFVVRFSM